MDQIINFTGEHWGVVLLSAIPALINLVIFFYVFLFVPRSKIAVVFSLFVAAIMILQFQDTFIRLSATHSTAVLWQRALMIGGIFSAPLGLHFALYLRDYNIADKAWIKLLIYAPGVVFLILNSAGINGLDLQSHDAWSWITIPASNFVIVGELLVLYLATIGVLTMVILVQYALKARKKSNEHRNKAYLITIGYCVPTFVAIITQASLPQLFGIDEIPLSSSTILIFSVMVIIALRKYRLLQLSPQIASQQIVDTMNEGIIMSSPDMVVQYANDRMCEMLGYSSEEIIGQKDLNLLYDDEDKSQMSNVLKQRKCKRAGKYEIKLRKKNGEPIDVLASGSPLLSEDGRVVGTIGIMTDITPNNIAKANLQNSEEKFRSLVETANDAIVITDNNDSIVNWNQAANKMFQFSLAEIRGKRFKEVMADHEKVPSSTQLSKFMLKVVNRKAGKTFEAEGKRKNGDYFPIEISINSWESGGRRFYCRMVKDITKRKQLETKLKNSNKDLNMFVYKAAHDLRGPLASLIGITNLASSDVQSVEDANQYFELIQKSTTRLNVILDDLSALTNLSRAGVNQDAIDIKEEIKIVLGTIDKMEGIEKVAIKTYVDLGNDIYTDRRLINTVFQNMIINSINYRNQDEEQSFLKIMAYDHQDGVLMTFRDNGQGMSKEVQSKVFEMFYRGNTDSKGTGLGLYIVRNSVEKLGGWIEIESQEGIGTTFKIYFPNLKGSNRNVHLKAS